MSNSVIKASGKAEMVEICAGLAKENIIFKAKEEKEEEWTIEILGY